MLHPGFSVGIRQVGGDAPCLVVAEIGINHDNNYDQAVRMVKAAADAGCGAVKFQLFRADRMYVKGAGAYQTASSGKQDILDIITHHELPEDWLVKLRELTAQLGLVYIMTVCDEGSADLAVAAGVDVLKIASYSITHHPLLAYVATLGKPIFFSTGCATMAETAEAVSVLVEAGADRLLINHCIGKYPVPLEMAHLSVITTFKHAFPGLVIGYSDHTEDPVIAPGAAVVLGAQSIEKHVTLDKSLKGPDHSFAVTMDELTAMVEHVAAVEEQMKRGVDVPVDERVLGSSARRVYPIEEYVRRFAYRGIFSTKPIQKGEKLGSNNIAVLRPGVRPVGLHPRYYSLLVRGTRASRTIPEYHGLQWGDVLAR